MIIEKNDINAISTYIRRTTLIKKKSIEHFKITYKRKSIIM